jgi:hypothetical protein
LIFSKDYAELSFEDATFEYADNITPLAAIFTPHHFLHFRHAIFRHAADYAILRADTPYFRHFHYITPPMLMPPIIVIFIIIRQDTPIIADAGFSLPIIFAIIIYYHFPSRRGCDTSRRLYA